MAFAGVRQDGSRNIAYSNTKFLDACGVPCFGMEVKAWSLCTAMLNVHTFLKKSAWRYDVKDV